MIGPASRVDHDAAPTPATRPGAYDDLPDAVIVTDGNACVAEVNTAAQRLLGESSRALLRRQVTDVLPLRDPAGRDWWECQQPYRGLSTTTRLPERLLILGPGRQAGREVYLTARLVRGLDGAVSRLVLSLRDAAARQRHNKQRADLVSTAAHELRSPLTTIKGFTATLLGRWERFTDEQKLFMLRTVNADADRVTRLITELLDVSRIEAGRLELQRRPVDVPALAEQVFIALGAAGEPVDRFALEVTGPLPEVWADPDKLLQVLINLCDNALRHGAGQVTVSVTADRDPGPAAPDPADPESAGIVVMVTDEGGGLPDDIAGEMFGPFARERLRAITGLGLFIVRGIVQAHGGQISVSRGRAGGAVIRFTVPGSMPLFR